MSLQPRPCWVNNNFIIHYLHTYEWSKVVSNKYLLNLQEDTMCSQQAYFDPTVFIDYEMIT